MVARKSWIPSQGIYYAEQSNSPYDPTQGKIHHDPRQPREVDSTGAEKNLEVEYDQKNHGQQLLEFLKVASLANLAVVQESSPGQWEARGDPTEIAIQVFASRFDYNRSRLTTGEKPAWKQLAEFPFDSDVKKMSVIYEDMENSKKFVFTKGAVERVILSCTSIYMEGGDDAKPQQVTDEIRDNIVANMESFAASGLRVLALASKSFSGTVSEGEEIDRNDIETDLTFRGLIGLYDPPRPESAPSVALCHESGITVHMLTGDHPSTAQAIAADVGIIPPHMERLAKDTADSMVMTAQQFDMLSEDQIDALPDLPLVVARCTPHTKVRMIDALHRRKRFAAMVRQSPISLLTHTV